MVRRSANREAEDFYDLNEATQSKESLLGIVIPSNAGKDDEDEEDLTSGAGLPVTMAVPAESPEEREDGWDERPVTEKAAVEADIEEEEGPADAEIEEEEKEGPDWDAEAEALQVLDDPVRMYLREIGRVSLLVAKEERVLARRLEGDKRLLNLQKEVLGEEYCQVLEAGTDRRKSVAPSGSPLCPRRCRLAAPDARPAQQAHPGGV